MPRKKAVTEVACLLACAHESKPGTQFWFLVVERQKLHLSVDGKLLLALPAEKVFWVMKKWIFGTLPEALSAQLRHEMIIVVSSADLLKQTGENFIAFLSFKLEVLRCWTLNSLYADRGKHVWLSGGQLDHGMGSCIVSTEFVDGLDPEWYLIGE